MRRYTGGMRQMAMDEVLAALHGGVFDDPPWPLFLDELRRVTDAHYVSLIFRQADARRHQKVMTSGSAGRFEPEQLENLMIRAKSPYRQLRAMRPYALSEIVDARNSAHAEYLSYLRQRHIDFCFVTRITEPGGGSGNLSLSRAGSDFVPGVRRFLERLAPQIGLAVQTRATLERERQRADIAADAVRRLNFGWVSFDREGRVIDLDGTADHLFRHCRELASAARGQMLPLRRVVRQDLIATLADFSAAALPRPRAIHLIDEPWLDMLIVPHRASAVATGSAPVAVGYVHGVQATSLDRCEHLRQLFSLSRNEALLAIALTQGRSIVEAAAELSLTPGTARIYSKRIYAKTATRGQADLVRVILASVLALT
jgi:DNA-binding CsgD family transcriptional regulator